MIDLKQLVLDATNGGLDIILSVYPQAEDYIKSHKSFRIRDERTPSCSMKQSKGVWYVHDFGSGGHLSPFDCYMKENGMQFAEALYQLAEDYNVDYSLKQDINKPSVVEHSYNHKVDDWLTWEEKPTTLDELKVFIPFLQFQREEDEDEDKLFKEYLDVFYRYGWRSLESYTRYVKGLETTYIQTPNYPMFIRHCGDWQKIYLPYEYNKSGRFFSHGTKPKDYINGLAELEEAYKKAFTEWKKIQDEETAADGRRKKVDEHTFRLPAAIFCSGERDAMCVAMMGKYPLWLNSETGSLSQAQLNHILQYVEKVYNIPDIDETGLRMGRKFALEHLEVYTIDLPKTLRERKDNRGRARKDLRDYLELHPSSLEFEKLMQNANTAKFWMRKGKRIIISFTGLLYYLQLNGFYKWEDKVSHRIMYVQILENKRVRNVELYQISDFIRTEIERLQLPNDVKEAYLQSKKILPHIFDELNTIMLDFTHYNADERIFDFKNCTVRVSRNGVEIMRPEDIKYYTWEDKVIPFDFTRIEQTYCIGSDGSIEVKYSDSNIQKFIINSSRMYWREEFEVRNAGKAQEDRLYKEQYHFSLCGTRLKKEEIEEQFQFYFNKMYFIGNVLHRYKSKSHGFGYWLLENNIIQDSASSGGSGKSFLIDSFRDLHLLNVVNLDGRDKKMIDNLFFLERVDSQTDLVNIDDISREANFFSFYNKISGDTVVNPKSKSSFEIKFDESPYFSFTSNFAQPSGDPSTMRRLISVPFSDYYHHKTVSNDYRETRSIRDDMGDKELFGQDYTPEEYNADINFYLDCLVFYLEMRYRNQVCYPPMENINKRIALQQMGIQFYDFCETYFIVQHNTDRLIVRHDIFSEYRRSSYSATMTVTSFKTALEQYCLYKGFIFCPDKLDCYSKSNGRLIKECYYAGEKKSYEMIYVQTKGTELNNDLPACYVRL